MLEGLVYVTSVRDEVVREVAMLILSSFSWGVTVTNCWWQSLQMPRLESLNTVPKTVGLVLGRFAKGQVLKPS